MPAVGFVPFGNVFAEHAAGSAVDRYVVFIVKDDELSELHAAGKTRRFRRNAFHKAAFADKRICIMVYDLMLCGIELCG